MKILITGGHLSPALALVEKIRSQKPDWKIIFTGRIRAMEGDPSLAPEYKILPKMGVDFVPLTTGRLQRKFTTRTLISLAKIPVGLVEAIKIILTHKPDVVVSFGSYQAVPIAVAAWILGVPVVTHEQTLEAGLANKIISKFAKRVTLTHSNSLKYFPACKSEVVGNPVRSVIFTKNASSPKLAKFLNSYKEYSLIYVTGGSQGSHFINQIISANLKKLLLRFRVVLQTGDSQIFKDYNSVSRLAMELDRELAKRFYFSKFFEDGDLGAVLNEADFVISRAGANTVMELAILGKPAIFIPLPFAQKQEQQKNAEILARIGAAIILPQAGLSASRLLKEINKFADDIITYKKNAIGAKEIFDLNAADRIVQIIEEVKKH